jgi:hypothetical protein
MSDKVAFLAVIKQVSVKRTASEDREARLIVDFRPDEDVMTGLVKFSQLEQEMYVVIVPNTEVETNNKKSINGQASIQTRRSHKPTG